MKIRTDFVTNSSSSSFIVSRKGPLTPALQDAAVKYVEEYLLGTVVKDPEDLPVPDEFTEDPQEEEQVRAEVKKLMEEGWTVSGHTYELGDPELANIYYDAWMALKRADPKNFRTIDIALDY